MSGPIGSSHWMYNAGGSFYPYSIDQSLRFNDNDSAYLSRTPASAGNRKTWTLSMWVKRANLGTNTTLFSAGTASNNQTKIRFVDSNNSIFFDNEVGGSTTVRYYTSNLFRDVSSWYHFVFEVDTTQATDADKVKIYVNGEQVTSFSATPNYPSLNEDLFVNNTNVHYIGRELGTGYLDAYFAEVNFIDGTALDPTSFGETINGIWVPKSYSGSYGTNGFYLSYADSAAIGDDLSGNTNDFTANNLAVSDIVPDSPSNNWCTNNGAMRANITHSEGNLKMVGVGQNFDNMAGTFLFDVEDTDGWYWEGYVNSGGVEVRFGISKPQNIYFNQSDPTFNFAHSSDGIAYKGSGSKSTGGIDSSYGDSFTTGDVIGIAVKAGALYFYKNGSIQNSGTAAATGLTGQYVPAVSINSTLSLSTNYGQDSTFAGAVTAGGNTDANGYGDFKYSVPSGYKSLCSANLPEVTIGPNSEEQADDYFDTKLWSSDVVNPSAGQKQISLNFQPDLVWSKNRDNAEHHYWMDSVRGDNDGSKWLKSNATAAEGGDAIGSTTAKYDFTATGFDIIDTNSASGEVYYNNGNAATPRTYVGWCWKAGGTAVSNTDGSITSSVSANTDAGFSIVSYTGTGANATVGHGLSSAPEMYIVKGRAASNWSVYHSGIASDAETDFLILNSTSAAIDLNTYWNDTAPTASVFSLGTDSNVNGNTATFIAYCFHSVPGYQAVGSYVGNNSTDGPFSYTGFRPAWVMLKRTDSAAGWLIYDTKRDTYNQMQYALFPHLNNAEYTSNLLHVDFLSNGFKIRNATYGETNASGGSYIYLAFAEQPFKYSNAR